MTGQTDALGPTPGDRAGASWHHTAGRHWMVHVVNGVLMVGIGIAALAWSGASLLVVALLFATTLLANGIVQILAAIAEADAGGGRRVLLGLLGALSLLTGVLCLRSPLQTLGVIALLAGSWWIVGGVLGIVAAVTGSAEGSRGWAALLGVLSVIGGLVVLLQPGISLAALELTLGVVLILLGIVVVIDAVVRGRRGTGGR